MRSCLPGLAVSAVSIGLLTALPASAAPFFFSTGDPDGKIATVTRPDAGGKFEIESADDFLLPGAASITSATFTGLLTGGASIGDVDQGWSRSTGCSRLIRMWAGRAGRPLFRPARSRRESTRHPMLRW